MLSNINALYNNNRKRYTSSTSSSRYSNINSNDPLSIRDNIINDNVNIMNKFISLISLTTLITSTPSYANEGSINSIRLPRPSKRNHLYSIEMTDPPSLLPRTRVGELSAIKRLANNDIIIFGDHINSKQDRELESSILSIMNDECHQINKRIVIGLEMIENDPIYQSLLDTYISNQKITLEEADDILLKSTNWNSIWKGDFNSYLPLFHFARKNKINLLAVGVSLGLQKKVLENGLDSLTDTDRSKYVPDSSGFLNTVRNPGFQRYADKVIASSYQSDLQNGIIPPQTNLENYFGNRILVDEGIATTASSFVNTNPDTILVLISNKDRVIFGYGIQERARRHLSYLRSLSKSNDLTSNVEEANSTNDDNLDNKISSILVNPIANDSLSYIAQLQLSLAYGNFLKDQKPLANFIWFTNDPVVKLLTRPKNPISKEGDKPAGESSILKAF